MMNYCPYSSIPLYAHKLIMGEWYLGYHLCKLWLVFDYVVGSASTLCIVVISYDRYQMVSRGLNYFANVTIRRALKFMLGTWIIAMLNYGTKTSYSHRSCSCQRGLVVRCLLKFLSCDPNRSTLSRKEVLDLEESDDSGFY